MVATQVRVMDQKRVHSGVEFVVGDRVAPSVTLGSRTDAAVTGWTGPKVRFGPMLAMNTLVDDQELRDHLKLTNPDAIGGEMEAGGVYAAAAKAGVDWIAIKAICDWGVDKTYEHQAPAAKAAAEFVIRIISQGGLDEPPTR
jgi:nucleoside phosphorylase